METKDPALTKAPISSHETLAEMVVDSTNTTHTGHSSHVNDEVHDEIHGETKGTQTFQETVIGSDFIDDMENLDNDPVNQSMANRHTDERIAGESVTHEEPLRKVVVDAELAEREVIAQDGATAHSHDELEAQTTVNKGTDTFEEGVVNSEHVNDGDNPARQPDRRDQEGNAFDEGINEDTVGSEAPKSEGINDMNRYASIDNAQSRVLNPHEKD